MLVRPRRHLDESKSGHALRLADANGLRNPRWLFEDVGLKGHGRAVYCACCLVQEHPFWRSAWEDEQNLWCREHFVWLLDRCVGCGKRLTWTSTRLLSCRCGRRLEAAPVSAVHEKVQQVFAHGLASVGALIWLGALERYGLSGKPLKKASRQDADERVRLVLSGVELVLDWPGSFHRLLHRLRVPASGVGTAQLLRSALPGLERLLRHLRDEVWKERVVEALQSFVLASSASAEPLVSRSPRLRQSRSTQSGAAKALGVRIERLPALVAAAGAEIPTRVTDRGRLRRVISDEVVLATREQLDDRLSLKGAARLLGLPAKRLANLKGLGLTGDGAGQWSSKVVRELESKLRDQCRKQMPSSPSLSFAQALRRWVPVGRTADCFRAVFAGEISLCQPHSSALISELHVEKEAFASWYAGLKAKEAAHLTLPEVATQLRLKQQVVYHLASIGLLRTVAGMVGSRSARLVTAGELHRFKRSYIPLVWVAQRAGVAPKEAFGWASGQRMKVATGPMVDGSRQYFVAREKLKWRVEWPQETTSFREA